MLKSFNCFDLIAVESTPTRNASISVRIIMDYLTAYDYVNTPESKKLISILKSEVMFLIPFLDIL